MGGYLRRRPPPPAERCHGLRERLIRRTVDEEFLLFGREDAIQFGGQLRRSSPERRFEPRRSAVSSEDRGRRPLDARLRDDP